MPLLWLSIAFLLGIYVAKEADFSWPLWIAVAIISLGFLVLEQISLSYRNRLQKIRSRIYIPVGMILLFFSLGAMRCLVDLPRTDSSRLDFYNDRGSYTLTGKIVSPPDRRENVVYLDISMIELEDPYEVDPGQIIRPIHGSARVILPAYADWQYGDLLRFTGKPVTPGDQESFSYKDYLERKQIYSVIYFPQHVERINQGSKYSIRLILEKWRQKAQMIIFSQYPQPEAGLLSGILLGLDNDIPADLKRAFRDTGTAHIIAISGYNMSLLAGMIAFVFTRLSNRYWAAGLTLVSVVIYTTFVGGSPSVVRAAVMSVTALGGHLIGRRQNGFNALFLTAALMCLFNPSLIWDVSFQLSFFATFGLALFAAPWKDWLDQRLQGSLPEEKAQSLSQPINDYFLLTLAAQIVTLPVIALNFGRISFSSLLANPLILPVQPPILALGGLSVIVGALFPLGGKIMSIPVWGLMHYTNWIVKVLSGIRKASLTIHPQMAVWLAIVLAVFIIIFIFRNYFKKILKGKFIWVVLFLILACASTWSITYHQPDGKLHVDLVRAGDESNLILHDPEGRVIVLDPGKNVNELSSRINESLSPWKFGIDEVWCTRRSTTKNISPLSERNPIASILLTPNVYQVGADQMPVSLPANISTIKWKLEDRMDYPSGMEVFIAGEGNESTALFIQYGQTRILIPNGVDFAVIREQSLWMMENLSLLILKDEDISYIPPRVWQALEPQMILWDSTSLSPESKWLGLDAYARIIFTSDGAVFEVETQ